MANRNMKTILSLLFLVVSFRAGSLADDVFLRNGQAIKNCRVLDTLDSRVRIYTTQRERILPLASIASITLAPFDSTKETEIVTFGGLLPERSPNASTVIYDYPHLYLIPITAIAVVLAWDNFSDASDLSNAIDEAKKVNLDTSKMESTRNRKTVFGIVALGAGLINTYFALQRVQVKVTSNSVGLTYNF